MTISREIMVKAHKMTKEIKAEYPTVNYKFQLGICIKYLLSQKEDIKVELPKLVGSEKQIAWATEIRNSNIRDLEKEIEGLKLREVNGTGSFPELVEKLEKALKEIQTKEMTAKWWIEHKSMARAYIQKIKR